MHLIPEFVGRLPIIATLEGLDKGALIEILTKPKNAVVRQFQRLFEMENVDLTVPTEALRAIADKAFERNTGARGWSPSSNASCSIPCSNCPASKAWKRL